MPGAEGSHRQASGGGSSCVKWASGCWPFFHPMIVEDEDDGVRYLGEDRALSHRLRQAGFTPMADTSIRLWHYGGHAFGWQDSGIDRPRYEAFVYRLRAPEQSEGPRASYHGARQAHDRGRRSGPGVAIQGASGRVSNWSRPGMARRSPGASTTSEVRPSSRAPSM
jgi:hypothetical protein